MTYKTRTIMYQSIQLFTAIVSLTSLIETTTGLVISGCSNPFRSRIGDYTVGCDNEVGNHIDIFCHDHLRTDLFHLIEIKLPSLAGITFSNCTFTASVNLLKIIQSMHITSYKQIDLLQYNVPNRFDFQNLSTPQLGVTQSSFSELPSDLLYDVQNISALLIVKTKLVRIPAAFFSDWAKNLLEVHLYENKIRKISRTDFVHLDNLVELDLSNNEISEIESGAFDNLLRLDLVMLIGNPLHTLPSGIFQKLSSLTKIALPLLTSNKNTINPVTAKNLTMHQQKSLLSDLFKENVLKIKTIALKAPSLPSLPLGLFDDHKNLEFINLDKNTLTNLPVGIFKELKSLNYLQIRRNRLTSLKPEIFLGPRSIKCFLADVNNMTEIDPRLFMYLKSATSVNLAYNQIAKLKSQSVGGSWFSNAFSFDNISEGQKFQPALMNLNLTFNRFTEFNVDFVDVLEYSKSVYLSNNLISKINLTGLSSRMAILNRFNVNNTSAESVRVYLANNPLHCDCNLMNFVRYLNGSSLQELRKYLMIFADIEDNFGGGFTCSSPPELKNRDIRKVHLKEFYCPLQTSIPGDVCNESCNCWEYPGKKVLSVDCSHRNFIELPAMISNAHNWSIELNMSGNALHHTPPLDRSYLINITKLDLSDNNITEISLSIFSPNLKELKLHRNSISRLDSNIIQHLANDNPLRSLTMYGNMWICNCETHNIFPSSVRKKLLRYNFHEVLCYGSNRKIYEFAASEVCQDTQILIFTGGILITIFGIVISSLMAFYYRYQEKIKIWLYSKQLCLWFITEDELDRDKKYDAFISFSHKDEDFVEKEIIAKLEGGPRPFKLCLHYRDWLAGDWIPLQISRSVADSRRTVIILTSNFLESVWGLAEFKTAYTQALKEERTRLIVILRGDIGNLGDLDHELKNYLSLKTYIKWGDPWFWQKLKYALPRKSWDTTISVVKDNDTVQFWKDNQ